MVAGAGNFPGSLLLLFFASETAFGLVYFLADLFLVLGRRILKFGSPVMVSSSLLSRSNIIRESRIHSIDLKLAVV